MNDKFTAKNKQISIRTSAQFLDTKNVTGTLDLNYKIKLTKNKRLTYAKQRYGIKILIYLLTTLFELYNLLRNFLL